MQDLIVTLLQRELAWEAPADNRAQIEDALAGLSGATDLVVLPEMFTTGFSMNALANAEDPGGETEQWLLAQARVLDCAITGSIAVRGEGGAYNRMLFATPDGISHYDKRHLFRMAGEHKRYLAGNQRVIVEWRGWRILLQVCYDLRFPVFSRNRNDYDLAVYPANWPSSRRFHWRHLLVARAIENQACVVGVNRIGDDAKGLHYSGDSLAVAADGSVLADPLAAAGCASATLYAENLQRYRESFPAWMDADSFSIDLD
ncbi:amidohydrolase [Haliea sp. E17]|uniref:amidohydrolase n=1 Tax=Haliea sp. E17 TaxID=3401576 RepID=UPI003AAAE2C7